MELDPNYMVHQVKEEFGGLRYYFDTTANADEEVYEKMSQIVSKAEKTALATCERCGTKINVELRQDSFWMRTLCDAGGGMRRGKK